MIDCKHKIKRRSKKEIVLKSLDWFPIQSFEIIIATNNFPGLFEAFHLKATRCKTHQLMISYHFSGLQASQAVLLTHGDSIERLCDKFKICANSSSDIIAGIYNEQARIYGVQFHPEVDLTLQGKKIFSNFLFEIARLAPSYTLASRKDECIKYIRDKVGNNKVLVSTFWKSWPRVDWMTQLFSASCQRWCWFNGLCCSFTCCFAAKSSYGCSYR